MHPMLNLSIAWKCLNCKDIQAAALSSVPLSPPPSSLVANWISVQTSAAAAFCLSLTVSLLCRVVSDFRSHNPSLFSQP